MQQQQHLAAQFSKDCAHTNTVKTSNRQNCYKCGIYLPQDSNIIAYRLKSMSYECLLDLERNYNAMFKYDFSKLLENLNEHYKMQREELINYITDIGNKLQFSMNTINLGILYMDLVNMKECLPPLQFSLYAITCVFLASKAIEFDMKIPFISKLRKYTSLHYRPEDIKRAEIHIIKLLDWQLQLCTFSEILDFYFTQGIVFSNDKINQKSNQNLEKQLEQMKIEDKNSEETLSTMKEEQIYEIMYKMNKDLLKLNSLVNKDLDFFAKNRKILGLACIIFLRKRNNIEAWNNELEIISGGIKEEQINDILKQLEDKFELVFNSQPILTQNPYKTNYPFDNLMKQQQQIQPIKPIDQIITTRAPPSFLQPRKENIFSREIATQRPITNNNEPFQGNYFRQQYQKKITQEFANNNEYNCHNRKLYRLNTAYASFDTKINQLTQFN